MNRYEILRRKFVLSRVVSGDLAAATGPYALHSQTGSNCADDDLFWISARPGSLFLHLHFTCRFLNQNPKSTQNNKLRLGVLSESDVDSAWP